MTGEQAGQYLRVNPRTLSNWRCSGRGPRFVRVGGRPYYRRADLDQYIERHVYPHTAAERAAGTGR